MGLEPVEARQHDVQDDEIRETGPELGDGSGTVGGAQHPVALGTQPGGDRVRDRRVVVDHQHPADAVVRSTHAEDTRRDPW